MDIIRVLWAADRPDWVEAMAAEADIAMHVTTTAPATFADMVKTLVPDILVLDLASMELAPAARQLSPRTRCVVVASPETDDSDLIPALRLGALGVARSATQVAPLLRIIATNGAMIAPPLAQVLCAHLKQTREFWQLTESQREILLTLTSEDWLHSYWDTVLHRISDMAKHSEPRLGRDGYALTQKDEGYLALQDFCMELYGLANRANDEGHDTLQQEIRAIGHRVATVMSGYAALLDPRVPVITLSKKDENTFVVFRAQDIAGVLAFLKERLDVELTEGWLEAGNDMAATTFTIEFTKMLPAELARILDQESDWTEW